MIAGTTERLNAEIGSTRRSAGEPPLTGRGNTGSSARQNGSLCDLDAQPTGLGWHTGSADPVGLEYTIVEVTYSFS